MPDHINLAPEGSAWHIVAQSAPWPGKRRNVHLCSRRPADVTSVLIASCSGGCHLTPAGVYGVDKSRLVDVDEFGIMLCMCSHNYGYGPSSHLRFSFDSIKLALGKLLAFQLQRACSPL